MYAMLRNALGSRAAPGKRAGTKRRQRTAMPSSEALTVDDPPQNENGQRDPTEDPQAAPAAATNVVDRPSYAARMRVILILAIVSWGAVGLAIAWALGKL